MKRDHKRKKDNQHVLKAFPYSRFLPLVFFLLSFLVYANTLSYNHYVLDDRIYTIANSYVQQGITSFFDLVSNESLKGYNVPHYPDYRPTALVTFALEKSIFGNSAQINHFFNVLFYAILCVLLYIFLRRILNGYLLYVPVLITSLFVLHPIHTEVVANIKSRDELLCVLFGLSAMIAIFQYCKSNKILFLVLSCIAFFLCLVSKESGYSFLGLIPLFLYFFTDLSLKRIVILILPFTIITGGALLLRVNVLGSLLLGKDLTVMDNSLMAATNFADGLATNFTMFFHAIKLLFIPINLSWDYSFNQFPMVDWSDMTAVFSLLIHIGLLIIAVIGLKHKSIFSFAILFYLIAYAPTSNLFVKIGSSFGERFLFLPSLGFCMALPFLLSRIFKLDLKHASLNGARKVIGILILVFILYAFKTIDRNRVWKDNQTLGASGVKTSPNSARTHFGYADELAEIFKRSKDSEKGKEAGRHALIEYQKSLDIYPYDKGICYNMGMINLLLGDTMKAAEMFVRAIELKPDYSEALYSYGVILFNNGNFDYALRNFKKVIESKFNDANTFVYAGMCSQKLNYIDEANIYFEKAIQINPSYSDVVNKFLADQHDL